MRLLPSVIWSWTNNASARWSMTLRRSPSVMLKALAVPARNASTLGKLNDAGALGEVLVDEMPVLAAKRHRMPAARVAERVDQDIRRINSALRERGRARRS